MNQIPCPKCGEMNPLEAVMCWACFTPLIGSCIDTKRASLVPGNHLKCPQCGESSPKGAAMCWACYQPFDNGDSGNQRPVIMNMMNPVHWWELEALLLRKPFLTSAIGVGLLGHGISRRSWRGLTTALPGIALLCVTLNHFYTRRRPKHGDEADVEPIVRIADTILLYAIKDGADSVEMVPKERGLAVFYNINGEPREQMKLPIYVHDPILEELKLRFDFQDDTGLNVQLKWSVTETEHGQGLFIDIIRPQPQTPQVPLDPEKS